MLTISGPTISLLNFSVFFNLDSSPMLLMCDFSAFSQFSKQGKASVHSCLLMSVKAKTTSNGSSLI